MAVWDSFYHSILPTLLTIMLILANKAKSYSMSGYFHVDFTRTSIPHLLATILQYLRRDVSDLHVHF